MSQARVRIQVKLNDILQTMKKHKKLIIVTTVVLAVVLGFGFLMLRNSEYWPQERVTLALPYSSDELPYGIAPMGETDEHPVPNGHPGIDFQWTYPAKLYASIDGTVTDIYETEENGTNQWNVYIQNGKYITRYKELGDYNRDLSIGDKIRIGDFVGTAHDSGHRNLSADTGEILGHYQVHWEFGYTKILFAPASRLCPTPYLNQEEADALEELFQEVGYKYEGRFPLLCNGVYEVK
jgi:hypothetical protein